MLMAAPFTLLTVPLMWHVGLENVPEMVFQIEIVYIQGVQDQNLPKEIGITKKLCTSDP